MISKLFQFFILLYQKLISPFLGPKCRFYPSCSEYSLQVFKCFPFYKAMWYSVWRILRCHPFSAGGFDPAPCHCGDLESEHRSK